MLLAPRARAHYVLPVRPYAKSVLIAGRLADRKTHLTCFSRSRDASTREPRDLELGISLLEWMLAVPVWIWGPTQQASSHRNKCGPVARYLDGSSRTVRLLPLHAHHLGPSSV
ncbi:uncharacterized protein PgNI_04558 [Pyricularia grisea]|uniref:Uncharacterized protein n=1 Tax=Pyricularia grisea TaxID=148305 RepID=A0A6P8BCJ9_PYRGI|nr:uncharacterized protein PgNI_04558 [Pyricularia grisea]TLD13523.1 hypothetical protein PgNI_04558 [Pyricularia grisea]